MLRVHQVAVPLDLMTSLDEELLKGLACKRLRIGKDEIISAVMKKQSVDARNKGDVHFSVTVDVALRKPAVEAAILRRFKPNEVAALPAAMPEKPARYAARSGSRPIVVGAGPAGLFCAYGLCMQGEKPILIERGKPVSERARDVESFRAGGALNENSNALFGEGGAGAFSDGKLTCGLGSPRIQQVLELFVECGAPREILTLQRPHIGTDLLRDVIRTLRNRLIAMGCEVHFQTCLSGLTVRNGSLSAIQITSQDGEAELACQRLYLAIGHSARDTLAMLLDSGVQMEQKPFAIGVRIEHPQRMVDLSQYGETYRHPALPRAEYKLNVPTEDKRGVYTFCMCPGGQVICASNEAGGVVTNGMSLHARDGQNANAALLVGVNPSDYESGHPLAGCLLQRKIEQAAFRLGGGDYRAPCQRVGDFLQGRASTGFGEVMPSYLPGVMPSAIDECLPSYITSNLRAALPLLGRKLRGFDMPDALLTAPETRTSSPVRIPRDQEGVANIRGVYPVGEGAGYAGGIMSAAIDGLVAAQKGSVEL